MPWENNSGGPWGGSGGGGNRGNGGGGGPNSPWGRPGGGGGRGPGGQPPDVEEMVRRGQEKLKSMMPGGLGGKGIIALALLVVLGWLATGFYRVEPQQRGAELVFGKLVATTEPGLNYNFPAPIGEVLLPNVTAINQVNIGFQNLSNGNKRVIDEESLMLTGDENIVAVQFSVFWKISDAQSFLFNVRNPQESVRNAAEAAMREIVGKSGFEYIRTRGRNAVGLDAQKRIQEILDSYEAGIEITQVNPQSVEPPGEVIGAFRDVQAANADRERMINQATAYFNEVTQTAEGDAQRILRAAEAYKEERVNQALGDSQRFLSILTEFEQAPDITKRRIYLQTMEEILERMNKVLIQNDSQNGGQGVLPYLPLDRLTNQSQSRGTNQ
ncbi:FtsH protease activity modulator HflK [Pacificispira sp.]|uniref:FtsH protease activity modulator HflK n=1 Tax=Pacificispira sp. TaxID=2888761 RepID=UPI003BA9C8F6